MLSQKNLSSAITLFFLAIAAIHAAAVYFYLYWIIGWFDVVMHFMGGMWLSLIAIWFLYFSGKLDFNKNFFLVLVIILGIVALGGVLWEFFEFSFDKIFLGKIDKYAVRIGLAQLSLTDTLSDLFFDLLGGLAGGLLFFKKLKHEEKT